MAHDPQPEPSPWVLQDKEPTTLVGLWPGETAPTQTEVRAALEAQADGRLIDGEEVESDDDRVLWVRAMGIEGIPSTLLVWAEPAQPLTPGELDDPDAEACRWVVGFEAELDDDDPLGSFAELVRLLASSIPDCPAVLDTNSGRWFPRQTLDEQFLADGAQPSEEALWIVEAVSADLNGDTGPGGAWVHTHGLWRCGLPELEMLEVPAAHVDAASEVINAVAGRLLEEPAPAPGQPFALGPDLDITLQRWQDVAGYLELGVPGGMPDREHEDDEDHTGVRAVICGATPDGAYRQIWRWPRDVVERLDNGNALIFLSRRSTDRRARHARDTWPQLATCFASLPSDLLRTDIDPASSADDPTVRFIIKAGLSPEAARDDEREHLWFVVQRFAGDRAEGTLINQPVMVGNVHQGERMWVDRASVSDWSVLTPLGNFDPPRAAALERAIDALREKRASDGARP